MSVFSKVLGLVFAGSCFAGAGAAQERTDVHIRVAVSVTDLMSGKPIRSLSPRNFQVKVGGAAVPVLTRPPEPIRVVILLDQSASMSKGKDIWQNATIAAARFVRTAPAEWSLSLMTFAIEQKVIVQWGAEREDILQELRKLRDLPQEEKKGRTALCDAILASLAMVPAPHPGDVVLVVTDGQDNASRNRCDKTREPFQQAGVRLFSLGIPTTGMPREAWPIWDFRELARSTGGEVALMFFPHVCVSAMLEDSFEGLFAKIGEYYALELILPTPLSKPAKWEVTVVDDSGKRRGKLRVLYPSRLVAAPK